MSAVSRIARVRTVPMVGLVGILALSAAIAWSSDACISTAEEALRSCTAGARSDQLLASGKCENRSDGKAANACDRQASADARDALKICNAQNALRHAACRRLGPSPYEPTIDPANFTATVDNPFFPLVPGTTFIYEGQTADGFEHDEFAVTHATRTILGVTCVEVHDTRMVKGVLLEDTRDWFAQDLAGNVWYFGENTSLLDHGLPAVTLPPLGIPVVI